MPAPLGAGAPQRRFLVRAPRGVAASGSLHRGTDRHERRQHRRRRAMTATTALQPFADVRELGRALDGIVNIDGDTVDVDDPAGFRDGLIDRLIYTAVF